MRLVVTSEIEPKLAEALQSDLVLGVLQACHPDTSLILEDCTFETTVDSPAMDQVVACGAHGGAHVGLWSNITACGVQLNQLLTTPLAASTCAQHNY
jgi:hypothetical protein